MSNEVTTTATTQNAVDEIDKIRLNLADDWKVLRSVYDLLHNGKAFCVSDGDRDAVKIVDFKQPNEMKVRQHMYRYKSTINVDAYICMYTIRRLGLLKQWESQQSSVKPKLRDIYRRWYLALHYGKIYTWYLQPRKRLKCHKTVNTLWHHTMM